MIYKDKHFRLTDCPVYKYELISKVLTPTGIKGRPIKKPYIHLDSSGLLTQFPGYRWDGCSGAIDTLKSNWLHGSTMQGGCVHDGLYQALRESWLLSERLGFQLYYKRFKDIRKQADITFLNQLKRDGLWIPRRSLYYGAVRVFGESYALPGYLL